MKIDEKYFKMDDSMKSSTIEDVLSPNETILERLKPNKTVLILESIFKGLPFVLIWATIDIFAIVMIATTAGFLDENGNNMLWFIIPFFALHLIPLWIYIINIIRTVGGIKNIEYVFTDKRIIIRSGLIGVDFKTFYYTDIEGINVKVGIFDRMFKVGDLYIKSPTQSAVLDDIKNPYFFLSKLQKITLDLKTDIYYPNNLRPNENDGYNTKYTPKQ